ncbi:MAG TPA: class I SAM-dependent methyltransferase [Hyphomicrobiaceae bacterium]|nr:class I SAM-dependent methyltransferase [Hyphomicrobiaceae bacterium]
MPSKHPLYWTGNVAKARVIARILRDQRSSLKVLDYGAGRGGDWPEVLSERPGIELVCYEPDPGATAALRQTLAGTNARVLDDAQFRATTVGADYIVSFSVLEHVFDRGDYLSEAKRHLAPDGVIHLNYDDGHFRTSLDLDEMRGWRAELANTLQNRLAWLWPMIKRLDRYQARVPRAAIDELIARVGLRTIEDRYENLGAFKQLAKTLPKERQQEFCRFWMATEDELNARFRTEATPVMGDSVNLWREMGSRTLVLRHA